MTSLQEIEKLASLIHEYERANFEKQYTNLDYDQYQKKTAKEKRKWFYLDDGTSGRMMIDKLTRQVFGIKAYGVPNPRHPMGTLDSLITEYERQLATIK